GDGVMRTAGQLAGISERPCQVERFEYLHDLLARLHLLLLLDGYVTNEQSSGRSTPPGRTPDRSGHQRGQVPWPPVGRTGGHQRAATWPPPGTISWPPTRWA